MKKEKMLQRLADLCMNCLSKKCKDCVYRDYVQFGFYPPNQSLVPSSAYVGWYSGEEAPWFPLGSGVDAKRFTEGKHPSIIKEIIGKGAKVLDVGCGEGWLVGFLRETGVEAYGIDYSPEAVEFGYEKAKPFLNIGSAESLPYSDNQFDIVIARELFEHLTFEQAKKVFAEMVRVSKRFVYLTIWLNFNAASSSDLIYSDLRDHTHVTFCNRRFWEKYFGEYSIQQRRDLEKKLDWADKGRCFVYELRLRIR